MTLFFLFFASFPREGRVGCQEQAGEGRLEVMGATSTAKWGGAENRGWYLEAVLYLPHTGSNQTHLKLLWSVYVLPLLKISPKLDWLLFFKPTSLKVRGETKLDCSAPLMPVSIFLDFKILFQYFLQKEYNIGFLLGLSSSLTILVYFWKYLKKILKFLPHKTNMCAKRDKHGLLNSLYKE